MIHKCLFIIGIMVFHGALAAHWIRSEASPIRPIAQCQPGASPWPDFTPLRTMMASIDALARRSLRYIWSIDHAVL